MPSSSLVHRRLLRRSSTDAETALWYHLRDRRLGGVKFRRQQAWGPFILDFFNWEHRLAIELDGGQHFEDVTALVAWLAQELRPNDFVLVKGSRGMRLERVVEALTGTSSPGGGH